MVIVLAESANIRGIEDVHTALVEKFQLHDDLALDLSEVTDADVSFLQLIEAARRFSSAHGKRFRLIAPAGPLLASLLERAGLLADDNADAREFWLEGGVR